MATMRLCMCACGRVGLQEADEKPCCYKCGDDTDNVDFVNVELDTFKEDLQYINDVIENTESRESEES